LCPSAQELKKRRARAGGKGRVQMGGGVSRDWVGGDRELSLFEEGELRLGNLIKRREEKQKSCWKSLYLKQFTRPDSKKKEEKKEMWGGG